MGLQIIADVVSVVCVWGGRGMDDGMVSLDFVV